MMGRSLKLLCIVSLTLNVFLLGAIAGGAYRWLAATHSAGCRCVDRNCPQRTAADCRSARCAAI